MPKINISGMDMETYKNNSSLEDYYSSIESIEPPFDVGLEDGAVAMAFKGAAAGVRGTVGAAKMAKGAIKSGIKMAQSQWRDLYPKLLQNFQKMGQNLKNMWAKLMKYDKRFILLGEQMNELVNLGGAEQINRMGKVTIKLYNIDWEGMAQCLKYIKSWDEYVKDMCGLDVHTGKVVTNQANDRIILNSSGNIPNGVNLVSIEQLGQVLNNVENTEERMKIIGRAAEINNIILARYNAALVLTKVMYKNRYSRLENTLNRFKSMGNNAKHIFTLNLVKAIKSGIGVVKDGAMLPFSALADGGSNMFGLGNKNKLNRFLKSNNSSATIVETLLKGFDPVEITFESNERDKFVAWIRGQSKEKEASDYCTQVFNYLGRGTEGSSLLTKTMRTGGTNAKKSIDKTLNVIKKGMEFLVKKARENDIEKGRGLAEKTKQEEAAAKDAEKSMNVGAGAGGAKVEMEEPTTPGEVSDKDIKNEIPNFRSEEDALHAFLGSYHNILGVLADNYQGFVQGLLMTTYSIVEDGESIVRVANKLRGGDALKKGAGMIAKGFED